MVFDVMRDAHARQSFGFGKVEEALHLAVEPVAHLLQHDIRIGILARVLADGGDACEDFIHVRQVEVRHRRRFLARQLFRLRNGCTYERPDFPVVE